MSLFLGLYPCLVKEFLNTLGFAWSLGPLFYFIEMDFIFIPKKKKKWILYCYTTELNFTYLSFNESLFTKAVLGCYKTFFGNTYFSEMLIFGKEKCFHGVWLHCKKFSEKYSLVFGKEGGKHKSEKYKPQIQNNTSKLRLVHLNIFVHLVNKDSLKLK